jgi:hypothetical protein
MTGRRVSVKETNCSSLSILGTRNDPVATLPVLTSRLATYRLPRTARCTLLTAHCTLLTAAMLTGERCRNNY